MTPTPNCPRCGAPLFAHTIHEMIRCNPVDDAPRAMVPQPDLTAWAEWSWSRSQPPVAPVSALKVRTDLKPQEPAPFSGAAADALFSKLRAELLPQPAPVAPATIPAVDELSAILEEADILAESEFPNYDAMADAILATHDIVRRPQ